jgi:hypothetical protein
MKTLSPKSQFLFMATLLSLSFLTGCFETELPGKKYSGKFKPLDQTEQAAQQDLRKHVTFLVEKVGERNLSQPDQFVKAIDYIVTEWGKSGFKVEKQEYSLAGPIFYPTTDKVKPANLVVEIPGSDLKDEIVVVGGHYDTASATPGADDNASAVAALLVLSQGLKDSKPRRTIRFVAFANEEPPFFKSENMGSLVYAGQCKKRGDQIVGAIILEMLGTYSEEKDSQSFPFPLGLYYPNKGNFITFVSNKGSKKLLDLVGGTFRKVCEFPSEGLAASRQVTGVDFSDHWSFWQHGYKAIMMTDTSFYRNPRYHTTDDLPRFLDFERMARVVCGLELTMKELANCKNDKLNEVK